MATKKKEAQKYRCNFCAHKTIYIGDVMIFDGFELSDELGKDKQFMQAFNRALELGTICHC